MSDCAWYFLLYHSLYSILIKPKGSINIINHLNIYTQKTFTVFGIKPQYFHFDRLSIIVANIKPANIYGN